MQRQWKTHMKTTPHILIISLILIFGKTNTLLNSVLVLFVAGSLYRCAERETL